MLSERNLLTTLAVTLVSAASLLPTPSPRTLANAPSVVLPADSPCAAAHTLSLAQAKQLVGIAADQARQAGAGGAFAVVDGGGNLLYLERLDGTFAAAAAVATGKARTSAMFQKPTRVFEEAINKGRTAMAGLADFTPLQGGVPLMHDGHLLGAIGVSGAKSAQHDDELASAAASAVDTVLGACCAADAARSVSHFDKATVDGAFAKGQPLLEVDGFKIHASRRETAGEAEVHARETDVIYVLQGTATLVTGGQVVGGRATAPDEVRGDAIEHGQAREIKPGDVVVVPAGTPHWFQAVRGPVLYYVVKVLGASPAAVLAWREDSVGGSGRRSDPETTASAACSGRRCADISLVGCGRRSR